MLRRYRSRRQFFIQIDMQIRCIKVEDNATAIGQVDNEAPLADGMPIGRYRRRAWCMLFVAVGKAPASHGSCRVI